MPWFVSDAGCNGMGGHVPTTSLMTTVTASATVNAVGNWIQLHAGVTFPVFGVELFMGKTGWAVAASNTQALLDLGRGASGAEVAISQDIAFGGSVAFASWSFPLYIPIGSRVVMRVRSAVASKANTFAIRLFGGGQGIEAAHRAVTYGAVTASSTGTAIAAPTAINTKSAWTAIATTTAPARWMLVGISSPPTTTATAGDGLLDIGTGATPGVIIPDLPFSVSVNEEINCGRPLLFPVDIPAGISLAARYQCTSISTASRPNITLTGFG